MLNDIIKSPTPKKSSKVLIVLLTICLLIILIRTFYIQVINKDFYLNEGNKRFVRNVPLIAYRGNILDRNNKIIASSIDALSIWANPEEIDLNNLDINNKLNDLSKIINLNFQELKFKINNNRKFVYLKHQIDLNLRQKIQELNINGIYFEKSYKRVYPENESLAHILGFNDLDDNGQEGIELFFNNVLKGKNGNKQIIKNATGKLISDNKEYIKPINGINIQLSIDSKIQNYAYKELKKQILEHKAQSGSVVVLNAKTGEILSLTNYPSFNSNNRKTWNKKNLKNSAVTDVFEPGSTAKPFTVAVALENRKINLNTIIDTNPGYLMFQKRRISDTKNFGRLNVAGIIQHSSNVGMVKISQNLSALEMWENFINLGFGQKPNLDFPGAASGSLRLHSNWKPIEKATMSYGYGFSVSLLQLARAYTVFANEGKLLPVTLLKDEISATKIQVFSKDTANKVLEILTQAIDETHQARTLEFSVAGKSGTARKQIGKNYVLGKYRSWFVGLAPAENPQIIVAVMIDEPSKGIYYGGAVAAPVFSKVVRQTLKTLNAVPVFN